MSARGTRTDSRLARKVAPAIAVVALGLAALPATAGAVPSITVTPNTGLYSGQDVNITGTGFEHSGVSGGDVEFLLCAEGTTSCGQSQEGRQAAKADAGGAFNATYTADPYTGGIITPGSPPPLNCYQGPCEVAARQVVFGCPDGQVGCPGQFLEARAPIRFGPTSGGGPTDPGDDFGGSDACARARERLRKAKQKLQQADTPAEKDKAEQMVKKAKKKKKQACGSRPRNTPF